MTNETMTTTAPTAWRRALATGAALALAIGLSACGGGGGGGTDPSPDPTSPEPPPATAPAPTKAQAARFLNQASFGATDASIDRVVAIGYSRWLDEQMALPASKHLPSVPTYRDALTPKIFGPLNIQSTFWRQSATAPDQLRQRLMFAFSEVFVISMEDMNVVTYPRGVASYMDLLAERSTGNYRELLEGVTLHPMMGLYLSHLGNRKEDAATGRIPGTRTSPAR